MAVFAWGLVDHLVTAPIVSHCSDKTLSRTKKAKPPSLKWLPILPEQ